MAKWFINTPEQEAALKKWVSQRPKVIQRMIEKYKLRTDTVYYMDKTGYRVTLYSLSENGTVMVNVSEELNPERMVQTGGLLDRRVFGVDPARLVECDLPEGYIPEDGRRQHELSMREHNKVIELAKCWVEIPLRESMKEFQNYAGYSRRRAKKHVCRRRNYMQRLLDNNVDVYYVMEDLNQSWKD